MDGGFDILRGTLFTEWGKGLNLMSLGGLARGEPSRRVLRMPPKRGEPQGRNPPPIFNGGSMVKMVF